MLSIAGPTHIFLVAGPTDMRNGFNGLAAIVRNDLQRNPLAAGELFIFCNRSRNRLKILFWDRGGLWVCAKRLEKGTFAWPTIGTPYIEMSSEELTLLLSGIDVKHVRRRPWYELVGAHN